MPKISRLAFIGFGHTAERMLKLGLNRPDRIITAFDPNALQDDTCKAQLERFIFCGVQGCFSVADAMHSAHLVLLSDSEQDLSPWLKELKSHIQPGQIVADLRTHGDDKSQLKQGVEDSQAIYLDGQLQVDGSELAIASTQTEAMLDMLKSLEVSPHQIAVCRRV